MVLVDPPFSVPRGTYLWESGYEACVNPETGRQHLGVRLTPVASVLGTHQTVFVRKCTLRVDDALLKKIHTDVFLKPYDTCLSDWLLATLRLDTTPQKTDRFWCSAFIAYVLVRLGWLPDGTDWSIARPCDLSSSSGYLAWEVPVYTRDTLYLPTSPRRAESVASLVAKLAASGVQWKQASDSELRVYFRTGFVRVACTGSSFRTSVVDVIEPTASAAPRAFDSVTSLTRYILELLDARGVA
jgi:hypothetical protein